MSLVFGKASHADAAAIAALRLAAARQLTSAHGIGPWAFALESEASVRAEMVSSTVLFAREDAQIVATARLATRNPWLGETDFFTPCARPVFLTAMAVMPSHQRTGIGRELLKAATYEARRLGGEAVRLDSYYGPGGAEEFYRKCGFREVRRGDYNGTALVWFEWLLMP
jgi:GNAT superfamily N-acetyltransferase